MRKFIALLLFISPVLWAQESLYQKTTMAKLAVNLSKTDKPGTERTLSLVETITDDQLGALPLNIEFHHQSANLWSAMVSVGNYKTLIKVNNEVSKSNLFLIKFQPDGAIAWITDAVGTQLITGDVVVEVNYITEKSLKTFKLNLGTIGQTNGTVETPQPSALLNFDQDGEKLTTSTLS